MSAHEEPATCGMRQELSALLDEANLTPEEKNECAKLAFHQLGATEINDISLLKEDDIEKFGLVNVIRLVPWRRLLQAARARAARADLSSRTPPFEPGLPAARSSDGAINPGSLSGTPAQSEVPGRPPASRRRQLSKKQDA